MKKILQILFIALGVFCFYPAFSQSLSEKIASADVIYVAPLQFYKYYGLRQTGGATVSYSYKGEFAIGDEVGITDPSYSYEIVGEVPADLLKAVSESLLNQLQEKWGADKVKAWPEDIKNKLGVYDEKEIDCKIYITMQRTLWKEPLSLIRLSSSNPDVSPAIKGKTDDIKLTIYEKVKAGKKGKKVVRISKSAFRDLYVEFPDIDNCSDAAAEFAEKANAQLQTVVNEMLAELLAEIEKS